MVVFYLRNSRNPDAKVVAVTIALSADVLKPQAAPVRSDQVAGASGTEYSNLADPEGDQSWILIAETNEVGLGGNRIPREVVNLVTTGTVHLEIEAALGRIGSQVDWGTIAADIKPPKLVEITPALDQTTNVPITSNIIFRLQEPLPAAGIDLSTLNVQLNGFDITGDVELRGNIFDLTGIYRPKRVFS
jgi:hypothetical protein